MNHEPSKPNRAPSTRGARKLEAAVEAFGLASAIRDVRAIDVGASSGGFTRVLLAHGAREVTAIDVGHGQLSPELRADARVQVYERTDFRRAPLALAPGPFGFFCVDVSFMAARNVLRALAFRLVPGARGIVLLKPQFELSKKLVRDGDVSDPKLRERAFALFHERAEGLGFEIVAREDSAVTGGAGTREIFLHLRFEARPAKLPQPGERRRAAAGPSMHIASARTTVASGASLALDGGELAWFAVAAPGLESVLAEELHGLPELRACEQLTGGVAFRGPLAAGYAANLGSRIASRVLLRLGAVDARDFGSLRRKLGRLPFERLLPSGDALRIDASSQRSRLYHTGALAEAVLHAIADRTGVAPRVARGAANLQRAESDEPARVETEADDNDETRPRGDEGVARVLIRGDENRFTLSVDTSGELLHRRGAHFDAGSAQLRETFAAGLLRLSEYDPSRPLVNAMCGAGTIVLEAAEIALGRAPGLGRSFAFERFPCFDQATFAALRERFARAERAEPPAPVIGFDRDARAIARARRKLERAKLPANVQLVHEELGRFTPPPAPGLVIANPPYGHRFDGSRAAELQRAVASALRVHFRGYQVALLVPRTLSARSLGLDRARSIPLLNGGRRVQLLLARA